jgi:inosine/xanthosine triphosphatase
MRKILLGTTSKSKLDIIRSVFDSGYEIIPVEVKSGITDQPLDEDTTIEGAVNRAKNATVSSQQEYEFSIGLEGGLEKINNLYYLVCVAALIDQKGNVYIGISNKLPLPRDVSEDVEKGKQFGESIREFMKNLQKNSAKHSTQLIEHIQELIDRKKSFSMAINTALFAFKFREKFVR